MAIDLQVVFPQEAVLLSKVRLLPGPVRAIEVLGADFRSVDEVLINDIRSIDVVVLGPNKLIAQVPEGVQGQRILSVTVLSKRLTMNARSILRFRISNTPGKVSGIQRLVQRFLKVLLTTPGTDIFAKRVGAGALRRLGSTYSTDDGGDLVNDFIIAVDQAKLQIIAIQSKKSSTPRDELLLSARVLRANFNPEAGGLEVAVEILSQAGEAALANIGL